MSTGVKIDLRAYARKYYAAVEIYLKSQFKRSFTKVVETSARRLRVWSQGELRLYTGKSIKEMIKFTTVIERIFLQSFVKTVI